MKIYCKEALNRDINTIGKYLYKHIDGAYDYEKRSNENIVYFTVYYQLPKIERYEREDDEMHEINMYISLTTYADKIRVNLCSLEDDREMTLGHTTFPGDHFYDLKAGCHEVNAWIRKVVDKKYQDYDFLY